ncbi:MAG: hypothetical protein ABI367_15820 [Mucilaginibacter sp.]
MALEISQKRNSKLIYIIGLTLLTGTLDAVAAILTNLKVSAATVFQYIASGVFGKAAFAGGTTMELYGMGLHYLIALLFTTALFLLHPMFYSWFRFKFLTGIIYGVAIFFIMNRLVVPFSQIPPKPFDGVAAIKASGILIICFGLPISYIATGYYFYKRK